MKGTWLVSGAALGVLLSLLLLVAVFYRLDWPLFLVALRRVDFPVLLVAACFILCGMIMRAWRWQMLFGDDARFRIHFFSVAVCYLGNLIYPAKAGEVLRVFALARAAQVPLARAVVSAVADRLSDVIVLLMMVGLLVALHGEHVLGYAARFVSGILLVAAVAAVLLLVARGKVLSALVLRLADRIPHATRGWLAEARTALEELRRRLRHPGLALRLIVANGAAVAADYTALWVALHACGLDLPFSSGLTVGVFLAAAQSLPSSPGYVGVYQVAVVLALYLYAVPQETALAASLVLHVTTIGVIAALGLWAVATFGAGVLRRRSSEPRSEG